MKKLFASAALVVCCVAASIANAQTRALGNFDVSNGVQVSSPPPAPKIVAPAADGAERLTKNKKSRRSERFSKTGKRSLIQPTLMAIPSGVAASKYNVKTVYAPPPVDASRAMLNFTTGDRRVDAFIVEAGARNGVDPMLLYSVMHQESGFKARALSNKGAAGLMQLMPGTATRFGVQNRYDPYQSVNGGARYIRFLLDFFGGSVPLALAGYNAGEGAVLKYGRQVPPYRETQEYVRRIMARYTLIRNPSTARTASALAPTQLAAVQTEKPLPLPVFEQQVYAVRLPDGKLRLVRQ